MSMTHTEEIELRANSTGTLPTAFESADNIHSNHDDVPASIVEAIPDGGYG